MNLRPGRIISIAIVLAWACLMAAHWSASSRSSEATSLVDPSSQAPAAGSAELSQRGVFYRGARIGHIRERFTPLEEGYRAEQEGVLALTLLGRERRVRIEGSAETGAGGELVRFQFRLATLSGRSPIETTVLGRVEDRELLLTIRSGETERTESRPVSEPIVLPVNLYYSLASRGFTPGETYRVRLFDPMTLSQGEAKVSMKGPEIVRWGGLEEEAYRLETTFQGLTTKAWVSSSGEVIQEETPMGWTLRKEAPGTTLRARSSSGDAPDVLLQSAVAALGFAGDADELTAARLRLVRFPEGFEAIEGGRQRRNGDTVEIVRESPPYQGRERLSAEARAAALAADAFVQADDPAIIEQARRLTRGQGDVEKARSISEWVYRTLSKSPTLSVPSAREILERRIGDCNEHTVLFTALARAVKLPTRISTGLAYTGGRFYYHAWPEVWVGRWLPVDPTFGQFPADPLHVRLLTGGLESQYEVLSLLGTGAAIEVLDTR